MDRLKGTEENIELTELAELIYNFKPSIATIKANIQSFLLANHYVKLVEDQVLPYNPFSQYPDIPNPINKYSVLAIKEIYPEAQQDMVQAGWRKVEREILE